MCIYVCVEPNVCVRGCIRCKHTHSSCWFGFAVKPKESGRFCDAQQQKSLWLCFAYWGIWFVVVVDCQRGRFTGVLGEYVNKGEGLVERCSGADRKV